jgi:hypothetical protein
VPLGYGIVAKEHRSDASDLGLRNHGLQSVAFPCNSQRF